MTIEEMLDEFTLAKRAEGVTGATLKWYACIVAALERWVAVQADQELTPAAMKRYLVHLRDRHKQPGPDGTTPQPYSDHSIVSIHRCLRSFFRWCEEEGLLTQSPMQGVKVKRPDPAEPRRALRDEVALLIRSIPVDSWIGLRDYLVVHTIFFCGLRVGEVVRLEERHFDIGNQVLHIPGGKTGAGVVPLMRDVIEAFLAYQIHRPKGYTDKLFVSSYGTGSPRGALGTSGVRLMIARRCAEAGIRTLNPHSFRHGIAMHLLNDKRVDATMVQRILRHANLRTTTTFYAQWTIAALADEYRAVMEED